MELAQEAIRNTTLILHIVGIGALLGGFLVQIKAMSGGVAKIIPAMRHGAWTMFVTGLILVGVAEWRLSSNDALGLDHTKIAVKLTVILAILVLVLLNRKKDSVAAPIFGIIGLLTVFNISISVVWPGVVAS